MHSVASNNKDGSLVKDGTIENISILLNKLKENGIDRFAITDHDRFDYRLYHELKKIWRERKVLKKVFPGVEFSVGIKSEGVDGRVKQVHVIAIFDDSDEEKIKELQSLLELEKYDEQTRPGKSETLQLFSEKTFWDILKNSEMNVCLIVHQKNLTTSKR